ncbi:MAG: NAD(P)-dependent oxidoreductase [Bacillota bacterium]|nr:NAD(P)-dependent oxidoreductase [Bacillota bacterium]
MNILVTGAWISAKEYISILEKMGHKVWFLQQEKDKLPCSPSDIEGVICNGLFLYHDIEAFVNLRYIQLTSAGMDRIDLEYVKKKGIEIHNAKGVYSIPIAEFVLASLLAEYKKLNDFRIFQNQSFWNKQRDLKELFGSTVCILGCGSIGNECAKRFKAFGSQVIGLNRTLRQDANYDQMLPLSELDWALSRSDIILLSLPLTNESKHIMNASRLAHCKQGAMLVNVARGGLIDTEALMKYASRFSAIFLDVFEEEPLSSTHPLWNMENVRITPHNSFVGNHNSDRLNQVILKNLEDLL